MTARLVHESLDGGQIAVSIESGDLPYEYAKGLIRLEAWTRGGDAVVLHPTRDEALGLVMLVLATVDELDHPQNTRSSAPPEDRGAGPSDPPAGPGSAAPTGDCRGAMPDEDRTEAAGLSDPSAESGRPASIAELTAARLAADPASADVPFEAGGALHDVMLCGCSVCEDSYDNMTEAGGAR